MFVRKIDKPKWIVKDVVKDPPSADAITKCLRTNRSTLSVWHINNETELEEAVLAIASGQDHLETIDVVVLDDDYIVKCEIVIEENEGETPVPDLKKRHRDLCAMDFWSLGYVAYHIVDKIKENKIKRFDTANLKRILKDAIEKRRLELSDLKDDVVKKIQNS